MDFVKSLSRLGRVCVCARSGRCAFVCIWTCMSISLVFRPSNLLFAPHSRARSPFVWIYTIIIIIAHVRVHMWHGLLPCFRRRLSSAARSIYNDYVCIIRVQRHHNISYGLPGVRQVAALGMHKRTSRQQRRPLPRRPRRASVIFPFVIIIIVTYKSFEATTVSLRHIIIVLVAHATRYLKSSGPAGLRVLQFSERRAAPSGERVTRTMLHDTLWWYYTRRRLPTDVSLWRPSHLIRRRYLFYLSHGIRRR